jgi:hypothetical protein
MFYQLFFCSCRVGSIVSFLSACVYYAFITWVNEFGWDGFPTLLAGPRCLSNQHEDIRWKKQLLDRSRLFFDINRFYLFLLRQFLFLLRQSLQGHPEGSVIIKPIQFLIILNFNTQMFRVLLEKMINKSLGIFERMFTTITANHRRRVIVFMDLKWSYMFVNLAAKLT